MIHYNNDNNAYCSAVKAKKFETREHNTVLISTFLHTTNLYSYSHLEIFICIYSVRGEIDQTSTNAFRYTICCAANAYKFVYILIGAPIELLIRATKIARIFFSYCVTHILSFCLLPYAVLMAMFSQPFVIFYSVIITHEVNSLD